MAPVITPTPVTSSFLMPSAVPEELDLEFVDMAELLQDSWRLQEDSKCCHQKRVPKRGPVTDILLWLDSYSFNFNYQISQLRNHSIGRLYLFNVTFAGRAKVINRCKFCISEHHESSDCVYAPKDEVI